VCTDALNGQFRGYLLVSGVGVSAYWPSTSDRVTTKGIFARDRPGVIDDPPWERGSHNAVTPIACRETH